MKYIILLLSLYALGCAQGYCYGRGDNAHSQKDVAIATTGKRVFIYKADGSKQCSQTPGETAEDMADKLKDIKVYSKDKKSDGKMHITLCGSPTDKINIFEIDEANLSKAKALGFQELENAP